MYSFSTHHIYKIICNQEKFFNLNRKYLLFSNFIKFKMLFLYVVKVFKTTFLVIRYNFTASLRYQNTPPIAGWLQVYRFSVYNILFLASKQHGHNF